MEAVPIEVERYVTKEGISPFREWFHSLKDDRTQAVIRARLARIRLGAIGDHKSVGDGVFELRIDYGAGYRVYFGREGKTLVILLCAGDKGSQQRDIAMAKKLWADHRREKECR